MRVLTVQADAFKSNVNVPADWIFRLYLGRLDKDPKVIIVKSGKLRHQYNLCPVAFREVMLPRQTECLQKLSIC